MKLITILLSLITFLLAACTSPRGHETAALGASIGNAQQSAATTGRHIQSAQKTTQQIDDELLELLNDSEP